MWATSMRDSTTAHVDYYLSILRWELKDSHKWTLTTEKRRDHEKERRKKDILMLLRAKMPHKTK